MAYEIANLQYARARLDDMSKAANEMMILGNVDEKIRRFETYIINYKLMYDKLRYALKICNKDKDLFHVIDSEINCPSCLMYFFKEMRNIIEHGVMAPVKFNTEITISRNADNPTIVSARSPLAMDMYFNVNSPGAKYNITVLRFYNNRTKKWFELPDKHRGKDIETLEMEVLTRMSYLTAKNDFHEGWQLITGVQTR